MTHADEHSHPTEHGAAVAQAPFSPAELESLYASDRSAAKVIVVLMAGIFSVGLVLYLFVLATL